MPSFTVFKGSESGRPKKGTTTKPDQLTSNQVLVKITASGLCGTDLHYSKQDMVLGHEGIGVVADVGPDCRILKKGDRVGWGYQVESCGHCIECLSGQETLCPERQFYGMKNLDQGSFATHAVWSESFLFPIPDDISDVDAAPMQCAGSTVYKALQGVYPGEVIGIVGVGGLGHLAIQFAAKMGCRVVVLSGSDRKKDEALKLGAHEFVATKGAKELKVYEPLNRLLVTAAVPPDWDLILPIMAPRAAIYPLTVAGGNFEIPYMTLILENIMVVGSAVSPRHMHRQMLEFVALHHIKPVVEKFPMTEEGIKEAMDKLDKGQVTYRAVLVNKE